MCCLFNDGQGVDKFEVLLPFHPAQQSHPSARRRTRIDFPDRLERRTACDPNRSVVGVRFLVSENPLSMQLNC
jgi:hypothetical protein